MALHKRAASQYHWFHLLSAVVCLMSFTSANKDPLRTAFGDNEVKHQWSTNDTGTDEGAEFEDRARFPESVSSLVAQVTHNGGESEGLEKAIFEAETALTKPKIEKVHLEPTAIAKNYNALSIKKLGVEQIEMAWDMIKNGHKLLKEDGQLQDGHNLLMDIDFIKSWTEFSGKTWKRESPTRMLYSVLMLKLSLPQLLEVTMKGFKYSEKFKGPQDSAIIEMQANANIYAVPDIFRGFLRNDFLKSSDMKELFIQLQLNKDPGPLANPFLSILAHYLSELHPDDDLFPLISSYYASDSNLAHAMANAGDTQEKRFLLKWHQKLNEIWEKEYNKYQNK